MRQRVAAARSGVLGTLRPDGRPNLVPVTFALDGDTVYTAVDHKPKRTRRLRRLDHIRSDPRVALLVDGYDEDWSALWWCRLDGDASIVGDGDGLARAADALTAKYEQYRGQRPAGPAIVVAVTGWTGWRARS